MLSIHSESAVESITASRRFNASPNVRLSNLTASGFFFGSLSYTPSTMVAFKITSASISAALRAAAVSVEKYGLPIPHANITILLFSKCLTAFLLIYGSAICLISIAVCTLVGMPLDSNASCNASELITVASIPIWSAVVLSIPIPLRPLQKLPPPTTIEISVPRLKASQIRSVMEPSVSVSIPVFCCPANASPLSFSKTLLYLGVILYVSPAPYYSSTFNSKFLLHTTKNI